MDKPKLEVIIDGVRYVPEPIPSRQGEAEGRALARFLSNPGWGQVIVPGSTADGAGLDGGPKA